MSRHSRIDSTEPMPNWRALPGTLPASARHTRMARALESIATSRQFSGRSSTMMSRRERAERELLFLLLLGRKLACFVGRTHVFGGRCGTWQGRRIDIWEQTAGLQSESALQIGHGSVQIKA